jgi:hypothetical protein
MTLHIKKYYFKLACLSLKSHMIDIKGYSEYSVLFKVNDWCLTPFQS